MSAISSTTLNFDDEPDFLGEAEIIKDRKASLAARSLSVNLPLEDSQSQSQDPGNIDNVRASAEIQVPATSSCNESRHKNDLMVIDELTQVEDSQPMFEDISLSEASEPESEQDEFRSFVSDKVYTGFIDRAAQKRANRTISGSDGRFSFKAVTVSSPSRGKRSAVSVIEPDDDSTRKKIMKEVIGTKPAKRKAWGNNKARGAVTYRASKGKENICEIVKKKEDANAEKRRSNMLKLMDSQNAFG